MKLIDTIKVYHGSEERLIEIYQGDLTSLTPEEAVDVLVVSAFPGDYSPTPTSLIGALDRKGVSVEKLAAARAVDLRKAFSCWMSAKIVPQHRGIQFQRILCFEPYTRGKPPEVVGDIFQSLAAFLGEDPSIKTVAMPLVATGDMHTPIPEVLTPLIEAAAEWLKHGLPLTRIKIAAYTEGQAREVASALPAIKAKYAPPLRGALPEAGGGRPKAEKKSAEKKSEAKYDLFISYAHQDKNHVSFIMEEMKKLQPDLRIFLDRKELQPGCAWQQEIYNALDSCRKIVAVYSPNYLTSKMCKEEFNIGLYRDRDVGKVLFPIYLHTTDLPTYMKVLQYIDCREADREKLRLACRELLSEAKPVEPELPAPNKKEDSVAELKKAVSELRLKLEAGIGRIDDLENKVEDLVKTIEKLR